MRRGEIEQTLVRFLRSDGRATFATLQQSLTLAHVQPGHLRRSVAGDAVLFQNRQGGAAGLVVGLGRRLSWNYGSTPYSREQRYCQQSWRDSSSHNIRGQPRHVRLRGLSYFWVRSALSSCINNVKPAAAIIVTPELKVNEFKHIEPTKSAIANVCS